MADTWGRLAALRLRARIAAGQAYAAAWAAGRRLLRAVPPESWLGQRKRALSRALRPRGKKKVDLLYAAFARAYPQARFVQIGANDGVMEDPLRACVLAYSWRGVFVEPVPHLFEQLRKNYPRREGLAFANVAVTSHSGRLPFHFLRDAGGRTLPAWYSGLGSFSRDNVLKHRDAIPGIESLLQVQDVPCVTFDELCARHGVTGLDVLNIDTEGHDFEILKTIDFARWRPRLLVYERHHLSPTERQACRDLLLAAGYESIEEGLDAICINVRDLTPRDAPVRAAWEVLRDTPGIIPA